MQIDEQRCDVHIYTKLTAEMWGVYSLLSDTVYIMLDVSKP